MFKRSEALQTVLDECMELAGHLPHTRRVALYRGLAELCGDAHDAARFHELAAQEVKLECQRRRLQCLLKFPEWFTEVA